MDKCDQCNQCDCDQDKQDIATPQQVEDFVVDTLKQLVQDGEVFTAFDVTLKSRQKFVGTPIFHSVVRKIVYKNMHNIYFCSSTFFSSSTMLSINGNDFFAMVYYPRSKDPKYHRCAKNHVPNEDTIDIDKTLINDKKSDDIIVIATIEKRVTIPRNLVTEIGWCPGDLYYIEASSRHAGFGLVDSQNHNKTRIQMQVNKDGRVRIPVTCDKYTIEVQKNHFRLYPC